jgi:hypothetical protein
MVTKPTGRPRGRPGLRYDPERYWLAFVAASISLGKKRGLSARKVALTLTSVRHGRPVEKSENIRALLEGRPFRVYATQYRLPADPNKPGWAPGQPDRSEGGRGGKSVFHVRADDDARKILRLKKLLTDDGNWFRTMAKAWRICLAGGDRADAESLALSVDELDHFASKMDQVRLRHIAGGNLGNLLLLDLFPTTKPEKT